jgi:Na+/H+ antiporter NhaC
MSQILDLRATEVELDFSPWYKKINWNIVTFFALLALGIAYLAWLDNGCALNGIMTWTGKVCIN